MSPVLTLSVEKWFNYGLNVLPTKDKRPLVNSWKEWQTKRQTKADLESMPWQSANGFAVICGTETTVTCNNETKKVYLGVVDIDHKDTFDFSVLPQTYVEKSPHGFHAYFWTECPPDATKHEGFELLGKGNYVCVYEQPYNNLPINVTYDIKTDFENSCQQLGIANTKKESKITSNPTATELLTQDAGEGQRDNNAIYLASKLRIDKKTKDQTLALLLDWNQKHCHPPLEDYIIEQKVESAFKNETPYFASSPTERFERAELRDEVFQELISENNFATLPNDEMYVYQNGVYIKQSVKPIIKSATAKRFGKYYLKDDSEQILDRIKAQTYKDKDFFTDSHIPLNYICVENGIIDIEVLKLNPHDPVIPFLNKLPVKYDPTANCPLIDNKMHEWLDSEEHVQAMYELIGYCLWREYFLQNAFFFIGEGSNGKTTLIKLITAFLGSENVSNTPIQDLSDEFKTVTLFGKLANIADELSPKALDDTSKFKQLTGDSPMSGYKKYVQDPIQFVSVAKQIYATNELPKTSDSSQAFFRRPIIFEFNHTFNSENGKKDPDLIKKLTSPEELSGLLNKAIEGLKRLVEKKAFTIQPSSTDTEEMWTKDTTQEFANDCLESGCKDDEIPFDEIYFRYLEFLKAKGDSKNKDSVDKASFALKLKKYIHFDRRRVSVNGSRQYVYRGIRFKGDGKQQGTLNPCP